MNRYGRLAQHHGRQHRPRAYAQIPNPEEFFTEVGEEIQQQVTSLRDEILGPPRPDESPEALRHRGYQAMRTAEEVILADHPLLQPETDMDPIDEDDPDTTRRLRHLDEINRVINTPL